MTETTEVTAPQIGVFHLTAITGTTTSAFPGPDHGRLGRVPQAVGLSDDRLTGAARIATTAGTLSTHTSDDRPLGSRTGRRITQNDGLSGGAAMCETET